jgi:hypothetical protein
MIDSSPESPAPQGGPPGWLERGLEALQDIGLSPHLLERFVRWWRRFGLAKTTVLTMAVLWPLLRFEILPGATSSLLETLVEGQGVRLTVDDWSLSLTDFSATAHGVRIETSGGYARPYILTANTVLIDASLWQNVRDGLGRFPRRVGNTLRWAVGRETVPLPPRPIGRAVRIEGAEIYFERLISGRGNWRDAAVRTAAPGADDETVEPYFVPEIEIKDLDVTYVEHLPADPGAGLEQSLTSTLHLDEATLTLADFVGPVDDRSDPTDFSFDARLADGRLSVTGAFNLWAPSFTVDVSVNNVGAATLGVLSPEASLVPAAGTMTGHVRMAVREDTLRECSVNVTFRDVRYRPNPRSPLIRPREEPLRVQLADVQVSGPVQAPCTGDWSDPQFRPAWAVQASMTREALREAPTAVQSAALFDQTRFSKPLTPEGLDAELRRASNQITEQVGAAIGRETGNAVSRGLSSVGRGVGRLFGRKPK